MTNETYEAMQARLTKAFNAVCNKDDWRAPIDIWVSAAIVAEVGGIDTIREAVIHFTATVPSIHGGLPDFHIRAAGYRAGPAGP